MNAPHSSPSFTVLAKAFKQLSSPFTLFKIVPHGSSTFGPIPHSERHFTAVTFKLNFPPRSSRNSSVFCDPNRLHSFFVHTLISRIVCCSQRIILVVVLFLLVAAFRRDDDDDEELVVLILLLETRRREEHLIPLCCSFIVLFKGVVCSEAYKEMENL